MKISLLIIGLIVIAFVLKACIPRSDNKIGSSGEILTTPNTSKRNLAEVKNDKIVVINGAEYIDVLKAVHQFCRVYNQPNTVAILHLVKVSDNLTVITFPYNIDFGIFCFFVNYMYYPENIFYKADIKAWTTTKSGDQWITEKSVNKKVMLYIPSDDNEHDNVYLVTQDGISYKMGFGVGHESQLLATPQEKFIVPSIKLDDIKNKQAEEIR